MITKFIFIIYLIIGTVIPQDEHEGRPTYTIILEDDTCIEYAYKGEIYNWIETGKFEYNEDFED